MIRFMPSLGHQILAGKICIILETFQLHLLVLPPCIALLPTSVVINSSTILLCGQRIRNVICYLQV